MATSNPMTMDEAIEYYGTLEEGDEFVLDGGPGHVRVLEVHDRQYPDGETPMSEIHNGKMELETENYGTRTVQSRSLTKWLQKYSLTSGE